MKPEVRLMLLHRDYVDETGAPVGTESERVQPPAIVAAPTPWSPAQLVSLVIGVGFAVFGIVAVTRTGFHTDHIYTPVASVWRMPHTPLLGVIEIAYGALLIVSSVVPGGMRALMGLLGALALVVGITALFRPIPHNLVHWLGVTHRSGVFYTIIGAVIVVAAFAAPIFVPDTRRRRVSTYT
jgi:hypothetical protein